MSLSLKPFMGIFGLPPPAHVTNEMITNSMPVLEITPGEPNFSLGLTLFTINTLRGWDEYTRILSNHGFSVDDIGKPLKFAFIADNFPTDTFTNEYTETFLQKFTDVASGGLSQIIQMSGQANAVDAVTSYGEIAKQAAEGMEGGVGSIVRGAGDLAIKGAAGLRKMQANLASSDSTIGRTLGGGMGLINKMLAGHRIDFPQIWSNSGYSPSYSATIRLYNPNPGSKTSTLQYIAGPLCALLCLAVPRTLNGASYRWPFYHKIRVRGLYELDPAVITNITVIKGGDQQQIGFNQMMSMCDVRIDFVSLHASMLLEEGNPAADNRPTVRRYIRELTNGRPVHTRAAINNANNTRTNANAPMQTEKALTARQTSRFERQLAASIRLPQVKEGETIGPTVIEQRVEEEKKIVGELLICQGESGTYVTREDTCL
jgi:hypothetical protein